MSFSQSRPLTIPASKKWSMSHLALRTVSLYLIARPHVVISWIYSRTRWRSSRKDLMYICTSIRTTTRVLTFLHRVKLCQVQSTWHVMPGKQATSTGILLPLVTGLRSRHLAPGSFSVPSLASLYLTTPTMDSTLDKPYTRLWTEWGSHIR